MDPAEEAYSAGRSRSRPSYFMKRPLQPTAVLVVHAVVRRWTRDRKVAGSTPGRGTIKSTRSTQPSIPPG